MKIKTKTPKGKNITIIKNGPDPIAIRISAGGDSKTGYYMVFRGDNLNDVEFALTEILESFKQVKKEFE